MSVYIKSFKNLIDDFNSKVVSTYKDNCDQNGECQLIKPNIPPYANMIYYFYSSGSITYKRGGDDYKNNYKNPEIIGETEIDNSRRLGFSFSLENNSTCSTYVILSVNQCIEFRKEMEQIIKLVETSGYLKPIDKTSLVKEFNTKVIDKHNSHCDKTGKSLLLENNNSYVYKFFSDGESTWKEGNRSEHTHINSIPGSRKYSFKFVLDRGDYTYAILTELECQELRNEMQQLVLIFNNENNNLYN